MNLTCAICSALAATVLWRESPLPAQPSGHVFFLGIPFLFLVGILLVLLAITSVMLLFFNRRRALAGLGFLFYSLVVLSFCEVVMR